MLAPYEMEVPFARVHDSQHINYQQKFTCNGTFILILESHMFPTRLNKDLHFVDKTEVATFPSFRFHNPFP